MENVIYKRDRIVLFAEYGDPKLHKHFAKHILVSNKPFVCLVDHQEYVVRSMIIQSHIIHSIRRKDTNSTIVVFLIDETSELSRRINHMYLGQHSKNQLPPQVENKVIQLIDNGSALDSIDECVIAHFRKEKVNCSGLDERILFALQYIEECETLNQDVYETLSSRVCLSKSRFFHLFKENAGIDLKHYLLLKRMEKAYQYVTKKQMSITDAAIMSGFSSASHFSEACKQHYGISLTDFLKAQKI